jgi:hypothetical protein
MNLTEYFSNLFVFKNGIIQQMIFGFVKLNGKNKLERDIRRDHKVKRILFNVIYGTIGFLILNFILYALSSN